MKDKSVFQLNGKKREEEAFSNKADAFMAQVSKLMHLWHKILGDSNYSILKHMSLELQKLKHVFSLINAHPL